MVELQRIYADKGEEFINGLLNNRILITQKISGLGFSFVRRKDGLVFFKNKEVITEMDRILMNFYDAAINYILKMDETEPLPLGLRFNTEYFPDSSTFRLKYKSSPNNQMILLSIEDEETKEIIDDNLTIETWSSKLDVSSPVVLFSGRLTEEQRKRILDFLYLPKEEYISSIKEIGFCRKILSIVSPEFPIEQLRLSEDDLIEGVVMNFKRDKKTFSAKIIDPVMLERKKSEPEREDYPDMVSILMSDIIVFMDSRRKEIVQFQKETRKSGEKGYLSTINHFYNIFIKENSSRYEGINLSKDVHEYFFKKKFELNLDLIGNDETVIYLSQALNNQVLYRIFLTLFRKKKKPHPNEIILTSSLIQYQNEITDLLNLPQEIEETETIDVSELVEEKAEILPNLTVFSFFQNFFLSDVKQKTEVFNLLVGEFQPFHLGHLNLLKTMSKENDKKTLVVCYLPAESLTSPISEKIMKDMFEVLKKTYSFIEDFVILDSQEIPPAVFQDKTIDIIGVGDDELRFILKQIEYLRFTHPGFLKTQILRFSRKGDEISEITAGELRDAAAAGDYRTFKEKTPECLWGFFPLLEQKIKSYVQ